MDGSVRIPLNIGATIGSAGRAYVIKRLLTLDVLLAEDAQTGETKRIRIVEIDTGAVAPPAEQPVGALERIPDEAWAIAQARFSRIATLINRNDRSRGEVEAAAAAQGVTAATVYDWIRRFERSGHVTSLIPRTPGRRVGAKQISAEMEEVIKQFIEDVLLTDQQMTATDVIRKVNEHCETNKIAPPGENTVRRRIEEVEEAVRLRKRGRRDEARRLRPAAGKFPETSYPMQVLMMDHTPADIEVVTDDRLHVLGRPWITLAIDVFSRMIVGYYLSMERPNAATVGMCICMAVLPKDKVLAAAGVAGSWPVWGIPGKIHCDNAAEFDSASIDRACAQHGIKVEFRAVGKPNWGGHIERLVGTINRQTQKLPGTTFSNTKQRGDYDSEKKASLTLDEYEQWLVHHLVNVYNKSLHAGIGMAPVDKYQDAILGTATTPARGLPALLPDPERLRIDFLPSEEVTVQRYGIQWSNQRYYAPTLNKWIEAKDAATGKMRRFVVRRDPRKMSPIWFEDPDLRQYVPIPFADLTMPVLSVWEHNEALRRCKEHGKSRVDYSTIKAAYRFSEELVKGAQAKTKSARKAEHRRVRTERAVTQTPADPVNQRTPAPASAKEAHPTATETDYADVPLPDVIDINVYD